VPDIVLVAHPDNTKALDLGEGTVPVPSGWQNIAFSDTAWITPTNDTSYGVDWLTVPNRQWAQHALFRWHCTLTLGVGETIGSVTGETHANDDMLEVYINNTRVPALEETSGLAGPMLTSDVTSLVHVGDNLIAFHARNTSGFGWSDFTAHAKLTVALAAAVPSGGRGVQVIWLL